MKEVVKYRFEPKNEPQEAALMDQSLALLFDGCWGSGKTHVGAAKALMMGLKYPNNCIGLVRKKRVDLKATLWKIFIDKCLSQVPDSFIIAKNDTELYRKLANGTEIFGVGLDSSKDVNKLASREYGFIVVEEATEITEEDYDTKIFRCLRLPGIAFIQVMLICNPGGPASFLYQRFIENPLTGHGRIKGKMLDDLPPSYYMLISTLTGVLRLRYVEGEWVAREGAVYPFDPRIHLVKSFTIPDSWKWVGAVDFGFDHAFVAQFWAISPDDVWYLVKEIYHTERLVSRHAQDIKAICKQYDIKKIYFVCDHDAEGRATLEAEGVRTIPAIKERLTGQQAVYRLFDTEETGKPRIYFFHDSLFEIDQRLQLAKRPYSTIMEFPGYVWKSKGKEDMLDVLDDGMDSMRYAIRTTTGHVPITSEMLESGLSKAREGFEGIKPAYERAAEKFEKLRGLDANHPAVKEFLARMYRNES